MNITIITACLSVKEFIRRVLGNIAALHLEGGNCKRTDLLENGYNLLKNKYNKSMRWA